MSKYTTEVRFICEQYAGYDASSGYLELNRVLDKAVPKVFDFDFPLYDSSYKNVLCRKILKHYYTREICEETVGLWKLRLDARLNEIMPYYNQLYESALLKFNPLHDVDYTTEHKGKGESVGKGTSNSNGTDNTATTGGWTDTDHGESKNANKNTRWDVYSDTPQGSLQNVRNEEYLTNARKIIDDGTGSSAEVDSTSNRDYDMNVNGVSTQNSESTNNINSTDEYIRKVSGKMSGKSYSELLMEYRKTLLNIDTMIIEDLRDLFFLLW